MTSSRRGVYPGSFDPLTIAHLAIADAAVQQAALDGLDLAISHVALAKEDAATAPVAARLAAIERAARSRPWLRGTATDARLIADIARGYDAVVMGADKWAQVRDPAWYGGDEAARDAAVAALPHVLVVPRPGFGIEGAEVLDIDPDLAHVSSTRARAGEHHLVAPEARRRVIVDGNNVIGSRPDGWWRDKPGAARRLIEELREHAARTGDRVAVVLDGRPLAGLPEGVHDGLLVAYARRAGRDAADDRIVEEVARDPHPETLTVVTSDRGLCRARARASARRSRALLRFGDRNARDPVVALDPERVERHRHEVVLPDGEDEVEQLLLVVVLAECGVRRVVDHLRASCSWSAARTRAASFAVHPGASGPCDNRTISSSVIPAARPMATCWPHSYGAEHSHPVRRINSSRSRGGQRALREHVVAEHHPSFHELRMVRERGEDVQRPLLTEERDRLVVPLLARERLHTRFHGAAA